VAAVPWELTYGSADFLVREVAFERGLPPLLPDQTPYVSEGRQLFKYTSQGALEDRRPLVAGMLFAMAEIYHRIWHEHYIQPAKDLYRAALAVYRELGDRAREAIALKRLGDVSSRPWRAEPSLPFYTEALALSRELGDRAQEALLLYEIGGTSQRVEDRKPAFEAYREALPIFRELGDRAREAITLYNMAVISSGIVSTQRTLELYREALALRREVGGVGKHEAVLLEGLVDRHRKMQQYLEALAACEQLIQFEKGRASVDGEITGLVMKMLLLHENLNRPAEALRVLDQALALLRLRKKESRMARMTYRGLLRRREEIRQNLSPNQRRVDTLKQFFTGQFLLYRRKRSPHSHTPARS
jgi:tetratricopeptide (TPR) repeat protein